MVISNNTVAGNLSFFARMKGVPKETIEAEITRVLIKLDLKQYRDTLACQLSEGLKRKLNIAIALLNDPKILIMDEPTSGTLFLRMFDL